MRVIEKKIELADGREITIETGKLAKQADGSVVVRMDDTMLLATVVSAREAGGDVDFEAVERGLPREIRGGGKDSGQLFPAGDAPIGL